MELKAEHIHKTYGAITVLEDISFSLGKGQKAGGKQSYNDKKIPAHQGRFYLREVRFGREGQWLH